MEEVIDIHGARRALQNMIALVKNDGVSTKRQQSSKPISARNAQLILEYDQFRALEGVTDATRVVMLTKLLTIARLVGVDFDHATKDDFKRLVVEIDSRCTGWSRIKQRTILRAFIKWERQRDDSLSTDEYPDDVRWIKRGVKSKDLHQVSKQECWTEDEMLKLIGAASSARDAAIASVFTETGARVGEVGSRRVGDVYQDDFGYLVHLFGKTGERDVRVLYSGPHLARWLNVHPQRDNSSAPLFPDPRTGKRLNYGAFTSILEKLARRAGVTGKPCNPHIFRHSRATLLLEQGWPEPMVKAYMGWAQNSRELGTYSHMKSWAANRFMLKAHGIASDDKIEPQLKVQACLTCREQNGPEAKFCGRCGRPLSHKTMLEYNHEKAKASQILDELVADPEFVKVLEVFVAKRHRSTEAATAPVLNV